MANIIDIEGIGPEYKKKLSYIGIKTTEDLLKYGSTFNGINEISKKTDIPYKLILEWVNISDLFRIKGVGEEYSDLLEEAGVDSVKELALRNADNLYERIVEINNSSKYVRKLPTPSMVSDWIEQARVMSKEIKVDQFDQQKKDFFQEAKKESQLKKKRSASTLFLGIFGGLFLLILLILLLAVKGIALLTAIGILLLIFGIIFIIFFVILYAINSKDNKNRAKGFLKFIYISGATFFVAIFMTIIPPIINMPDIPETTLASKTTVVNTTEAQTTIIENKTTTTIEEIKKSVLINGPMKCSKVIDGDTIKVVDDKGEEYLVQYVGIDIPEDFDDEAKNINEALLLNKNIELEKDISETDEGGRLLRYVYVEDIFVNAYLVEEGLAKVDTISPDKKYEDTLLKLEGKAKDSLLGFWASELTVSQTTKSQETTTTIQQETTTTIQQETTTTIEQSTTTTTQAQVYGVEIISLTSPVAQGANATIGISTAPGAMCNITVYYKSGPSEAQGLFPKQADGNGNCSWTWKVGTRTTPGDWRIVINVDGIGSKEIYFTVVG